MGIGHSSEGDVSSENSNSAGGESASSSTKSAIVVVSNIIDGEVFFSGVDAVLPDGICSSRILTFAAFVVWVSLVVGGNASVGSKGVASCESSAFLSELDPVSAGAGCWG